MRGTHLAVMGMVAAAMLSSVPPKTLPPPAISYPGEEMFLRPPVVKAFLAHQDEAQLPPDIEEAQLLEQEEIAGKMKVRTTFYIDRGITRWGCNAGPGIAATDPKVIPAMTRFRVVGWPGEWLACDTGSKVLGAHVDTWHPTLEEGWQFIKTVGDYGDIEIMEWGR